MRATTLTLLYLHLYLQVHKVLYLIGLGLVEEERDRVAGSVGVFTQLARERGLLEAMEKLTGNQRIVSHKELLAWTVKKFRSVAGLREEVGINDGIFKKPFSCVHRPHD